MVFKADLKARMQCHVLDDYYRCRRLCDRCEAIQPFSSGFQAMSYKNFAKNAPYASTCKNHDSYVQSCKRLSPWAAVPGFQYETVSYDLMHLVFLGIARNHVPSCLKILQMLGYHYQQGESDEEFLKQVSFEMKKDCKRQKHFGADIVFFKMCYVCLSFPP